MSISYHRWGFDIASGYKHKPIPPGSNMTLEELRKGGYVMNEHQWLQRILFLESVAGVPGMVAATLRHLKSLRLMVSFLSVFLDTVTSYLPYLSSNE